MKRTIALTLLVALLAAALSGCAGTNYGYGGEYRGNVSTTDNGYVNGTNDGLYGGADGRSNDSNNGYNGGNAVNGGFRSGTGGRDAARAGGTAAGR